MLDKIKITVPKDTYDILIKDCENFNFYKNENVLNRNLFLNTLIVNYYEKFTMNEESLKDELLKSINEYVKKNENQILDEILNIIRKKDSLEDSNKTEIINLKPTKLSEKQILFIENNLINNNSISSFYRNLFNSYSHTPQNYRELIIFKENYELLNESIIKERKVSITLKNGDTINNASIYKIKHSKEELFNYVLLENSNNKPNTIRLSKIKYVSILNSKREISNEVSSIFERQIKYGVEYPFYSSSEEEVVIKLSEKGKNLFKSMYLYRPIPDKVEDNLYYFNCSHNQIIHYFKRFGYDAIIISPSYLTEKMHNYYYISYEKYKKYNKKVEEN
jgi:hypothetical protein